jgi:hypothetical protein
MNSSVSLISVAVCTCTLWFMVVAGNRVHGRKVKEIQFFTHWISSILLYAWRKILKYVVKLI